MDSQKVKTTHVMVFLQAINETIKDGKSLYNQYKTFFKSIEMHLFLSHLWPAQKMEK